MDQLKTLTINGIQREIVDEAARNTISSLAVATEESVNQLKDGLGDAWASETTYVVGDYVIYDNCLYRCETAHTAGSAFDAAYWASVSVSGEIRRKTGNQFGTATAITTSGTTVPDDGIITVRYDSNSTAWAYLEVFINKFTVFIAQIGTTDRMKIFNTFRVNKGDKITFSAVNSPTYEINFLPTV